MKSKTIILSNPENETSGRGILTIYSEDDLLKCRLRLYNVEKLNKCCKLGIYHNSQTYSANLLEKNGTYESSFVGDFNISQDFYTAIINTAQNNKVIIAGGTYAGHYFNDYSMFEEPQTSTQTDIISPIASNQELTDCNPQCDKCANCIYKQHFYSQNVEETPPPPSEKQELPPQNIEKQEIKQNIAEQFAYIFKTYPENTELTNLIENSKFVTINEENKQYSIGAIFNNQQPQYLCYAVKCNYNSPAPQELGPHHQWLPIDKEDPLTDGYYLVFQDAQDLKILEL